jgi:dipeptidyl aminopeptidase/acylaminoacyl peptidase
VCSVFGVGSFSPDGRRLLMSHQSAQRAGDLWLYELGASHPRQLTFSAVATLHPTLIPPSQVAEALRQAGKVVEAHYYPNEGHGFAKRENQIDSIRRTIA